jgi:hypothetical protein
MMSSYGAPIAIILAVAFGAVALCMTLIERRRRPKARPAGVDALDTVADWPPQAVRVLTLEERHAYEIVRRAMPKHMVLAQVPLARFISVSTENPYPDWLNRAGRMSVDLLITDNSSRPVAAVEIHAAEESERYIKRHKRLARVLQAAGIPVHTWHENRLPTADQARRQLLGKSADEDDADESKVRGPLPVAEVQELLAAGDDRDYGSGSDPVASSFFDDLDAMVPQKY